MNTLYYTASLLGRTKSFSKGEIVFENIALLLSLICEGFIFLSDVSTLTKMKENPQKNIYTGGETRHGRKTEEWQSGRIVENPTRGKNGKMEEL